MAWNQPGNNIHNRNLWGSNANNRGTTKNNKKYYHDKGSPELHDIFRKLSNKLNNLGINKTSQTNRSHPEMSETYLNRNVIFIIAVIIIATWVASGFYTIKEAERGVVTRFGKFSHIEQPGLNWKPTFIDEIRPVNVESVRELAASGVMLTSDENVVRIEMNVQYRVTNPAIYLFSVVNADDSLSQATDSALRGVIGKYSMDRILTEGRTVVRNDTQRMLEETIRPYNMGITLLDVNFQAARPPEEVKASFDDAIAARENKQQYICEAEAYANEVQPRANGQAQRLLEDAKAYKDRTILEAQGEVARFAKLLPEYKLSPDITRQRLYIDTMEKVLSHTRKVLVSGTSNNIIFLQPDQIPHNNNNVLAKNNEKDTSLIRLIPAPYTNNSNNVNNEQQPSNTLNINQRQSNAQYDNTTRIGRE